MSLTLMKWDDVDWTGAIQHSEYVIDHGQSNTEACGFIEGSEVIWCRNIADPGRFAFTVEDCVRIYEAMYEGILNGVWHSHPGGSMRPSEDDWANHPRGVPMIIIALRAEGRASVLRFDDENRAGTPHVTEVRSRWDA